MRRVLRDNLKNLLGWRTDRKLVVFSVDDYGNVRLDSKKARANLDRAGLKCHSRFDALDTLETRQDLEQLFDALQSVRDSQGHPAVFTPFALPCNIDFETMAEEGNQVYRYELLPKTFEKLAALQPDAYLGAWDLWKEGIARGLMQPQFHGREHLNVKFFERKLANREEDIRISLDNRSYTRISNDPKSHIGWTAAFSFDNEADQRPFPRILEDGVRVFNEVFGHQPVVFTPPAQEFPLAMESQLSVYGLRYLDKPFLTNRHLGSGRYKRELNFTSRQKDSGGVLVRNVVFEPTYKQQVDPVAQAIKQIETAFFWKRPALISSHRVNFCGHIDPENRSQGLAALQLLVQQIVKKWPEVEFVSAAEVGSMISHSPS